MRILLLALCCSFLLTKIYACAVTITNSDTDTDTSVGADTDTKASADTGNILCRYCSGTFSISNASY